MSYRRSRGANLHGTRRGKSLTRPIFESPQLRVLWPASLVHPMKLWAKARHQRHPKPEAWRASWPTIPIAQNLTRGNWFLLRRQRGVSLEIKKLGCKRFRTVHLHAVERQYQIHQIDFFSQHRAIFRNP